MAKFSRDKVLVLIDYPSSVISVNHYKFAGGRFTRPEVKAWNII